MTPADARIGIGTSGEARASSPFGDYEAPVQRALRVRAETAALIRAAEEALDRSEAALRGLRRLETLWTARASPAH